MIGRRLVPATQTSTISKSTLDAEQSGHIQLSGTSSQRVPAGTPSCGMPSISLYTKPQSTHCHVFIAGCSCEAEVDGEFLSCSFMIRVNFQVGLVFFSSVEGDQSAPFRSRSDSPLTALFSSSELGSHRFPYCSCHKLTWRNISFAPIVSAQYINPPLCRGNPKP